MYGKADGFGWQAVCMRRYLCLAGNRYLRSTRWRQTKMNEQ